jgi:hypothetical protein
VLLPLERKQHSCVQGHLLCLHYALCLIQLSVVRNLILKGFSDDSPQVDFSHRCSWMAVYAFCRNAQSESHSFILMTYVRYLYSINCPTVICLPSILLLILWRDTAIKLWTLVQFPLHCYYHLLLLALFTFLHTITFYHSIRLILCLQQTGEIDNLVVSWEQSSWLCCAGFTLLLGEEAPTSTTLQHFLAPLSGVSRI